MELTKQKYIKKQIKDVTSIPENTQFVEIFTNRYWAGDNEKNIYFYGKNFSPVCNQNKSIVEKLINISTNPFTKIYFIDIVLLPIDVDDWRRL